MTFVRFEKNRSNCKSVTCDYYILRSTKSTISRQRSRAFLGSESSPIQSNPSNPPDLFTRNCKFNWFYIAPLLYSPLFFLFSNSPPRLAPHPTISSCVVEHNYTYKSIWQIKQKHQKWSTVSWEGRDWRFLWLVWVGGWRMVGRLGMVSEKFLWRLVFQLHSFKDGFEMNTNIFM